MRQYSLILSLIAALLVCPLNCLHADGLACASTLQKGDQPVSPGCVCCQEVKSGQEDAVPAPTESNPCDCDCANCVCEGATVVNQTLSLHDLPMLASVPGWTLKSDVLISSFISENGFEYHSLAFLNQAGDERAHAALQTWLI
ncbi:hypothetical protein Pla110_40750 [Polystyrenella longa]|uniref:Secreted protein n=1 Tax=Polystyrenella longa TaxID=2528007 RepID=A0A518CSW9_9PLAN|nr:hypothetical protein [Polystyrenella longa]QDU82320.1 hypothetical protein Pla110_40750 [Polystyrenella longa]